MTTKIVRKDGKPVICLNAIMKNESHLFRENNSCLNSLVDKIDYYIIVDTGSSDDSIQLVKDFFKKHNIPGEIHQKLFVDFGTNRTHALKLCQRHKWIDFDIVMDIDDLFIGDIDLHDILDKKYDAYEVPLRDQHGTEKPIVNEFIENNAMVYKRVCIFNNHLNWVYNQPIHEYPECSNKKNKTIGKVDEGYILSRRLGSRSKNTDKYLRDAKIFEKYLETHPKDARSLFYCGRSWFDYREFERALGWYRKRLECDVPHKFCFVGERFYTGLEIGRCLKNMQNGFCRDGIKRNVTNEEIINAFLYAHTILPIRNEALWELATFCRERGMHEKAYIYAKKGSLITKPEGNQDGMFFCLASVYSFGIWDELAMACFHLKKYEEADKLFTKIEEENRCPEEQKGRVGYFHGKVKEQLQYKDAVYIELYYIN